jgi:hypothetical protein
LKPTTGLLSLVVVALVAGYLLGSGGDDPTPPAGGGQAPTRSAAAAQPATADTSFWHLIAATRDEAGGATERQSELLEEKLSRLPGEQIAEFQRIRHRLDEQAYSWDLWGAAYVIEDGCSDDCFRDFRAYLISLGREPYEAALRDPDSLAPVVEDAETGDWENADSVAGDAYESAVGEDIPADDSDLSGDPSGEPWDDEDQDALVQRYPRLAERFR